MASLGLDTTATNIFLVDFDGHAWGQVIKVDCTQVLSFTVWRRTDPDSILDPMHLYVTEVDSTGRPLIDRIIRDGPALVIPVPNSEGEPVEVRYEFDPPLQLPAPGKYWFAVKEGWCDFTFQLHASATNPYPDGAAWRTTPDRSCQGVGFSPASYGGNYDLIFKIEFWKDGVPVQAGTWGKLKARYR